MIQSLLITQFHFINISDFQENYMTLEPFGPKQRKQIRVFCTASINSKLQSPRFDNDNETFFLFQFSPFCYLFISYLVTGETLLPGGSGSPAREAPMETLFISDGAWGLHSVAFSAKLLTFCKLKTRLIRCTPHFLNTQTNQTCLKRRISSNFQKPFSFLLRFLSEFRKKNI